jgi:hypothetical protein
MKTLGGMIGVDILERFTNHALRGYGITKMHQARVPLAMRTDANRVKFRMQG